MNKPKKLQLIELGPGRGTLMSDILRVSYSEIPLTNIIFNKDCTTIQRFLRMYRHSLCRNESCTSENSSEKS